MKPKDGYNIDGNAPAKHTQAQQPQLRQSQQTSAVPSSQASEKHADEGQRYSQEYEISPSKEKCQENGKQKQNEIEEEDLTQQDYDDLEQFDEFLNADLDETETEPTGTVISQHNSQKPYLEPRNPLLTLECINQEQTDIELPTDYTEQNASFCIF